MNKKLIAPIVTAAAMLATSVGSTFALFTSKDEANIAITAGKVSISAKMDDPFLYSADYDYRPESGGDPEECLVPGGNELGSHSGTYYYKAGSTFANGGTGEVVNGDLKLTRMSPGDKAISKIVINKGETNIDFKYRIVCELIEEDDDSLRFFSNLELTALGETRTHVRKFATNWTYWNNEETEISSPVKVVLPITVGNEVQVSHCTLRFNVEAVQGNAYTVDDIDNLFVQFNDKKVEAAPVEEPTPSGLKDLDLEAWKDVTLIESEDATVKVHVPAGSGDVKALVETAPGVQEKQDLQLDDTLTLKVEEKEYEGTYTIEENDEVLNYEISLYNQNKQKIITVEEGKPLDVYINIGLLSNIKEVLHSGEELVMNDDDTLEVGEYEYDENTGIVHILTNTFSPFSVIYERPFGGAAGSYEDPFVVTKGEEWPLLIKAIHNRVENLGYYAYVSIEDDLDFTGVDCTTDGISYFLIEGNNHKIMNLSTPLFDCGWIYGNAYFYDVVFENCTTVYTLLSQWGNYGGTVYLDNVNVNNCTVGGATFLNQVYGAYNGYCDITNCHVASTTVNQIDHYYAGSCGGFVGNISNGSKITDCSFQGNIVSSATTGGFVGQGYGAVLTNCLFMPNSTIEIKGNANAYAVSNGSKNIDCEFYGTIKVSSASQCNMQGYIGGICEITDCGFDSSSFAIKENGTIAYNGSVELAKVKVYQRISLDRMVDGEFKAGGFPAVFDETREFSNVTGDMSNAFEVITNVFNVTNIDSLGNSVEALPQGLEFNANGFAIGDNGVLYHNSMEDEYETDYISGTLNNTKTSFNITVIIEVRDVNDSLINMIIKSYVVNIG